MPGKARNSRQSSNRDKIAYFVTIKNIVTKSFNSDVLSIPADVLYIPALFAFLVNTYFHQLKQGLAGTFNWVARQIQIFIG